MWLNLLKSAHLAATSPYDTFGKWALFIGFAGMVLILAVVFDGK